jgi:hypothetical protein
VFGFKDEGPAQLDAFAIYRPAAHGCNAKTSELSAGDEGPTGAFKPPGVMTSVNGKLRDNASCC